MINSDQKCKKLATCNERNTHVYKCLQVLRYIAKGTIEERMLLLQVSSKHHLQQHIFTRTLTLLIHWLFQQTLAAKIVLRNCKEINNKARYAASLPLCLLPLHTGPQA